jgi:hypothetical protein
MKKGICKAGLWAVALIVAAGILGCQSDDDVTGPVILNEDAEFYGVRGVCMGGGYPKNGIECIVKDPSGKQWFNTGYSYSDPVHGDGWFECWADPNGEFPAEGDALRVKGRSGGSAWGASYWFGWQYPVVTAWVYRYW